MLVDIKIGNIDIKHECIIVEKLYTSILVGMDLLKILKTIIHLDNKCITFKQLNQRKILRLIREVILKIWIKYTFRYFKYDRYSIM